MADVLLKLCSYNRLAPILANIKKLFNGAMQLRQLWRGNYNCKNSVLKLTNYCSLPYKAQKQAINFKMNNNSMVKPFIFVSIKHSL